MVLSDPQAHPSREPIWHAEFRRRRARDLEPLVTAELLAELLANPIGLAGDQSEDLGQVLNFLRAEAPMDGRAFVYVEIPGERYRVARLRGLGTEPEFDGPVFASEAEAIAAVAGERLNALGTGVPGQAHASLDGARSEQGEEGIGR